MSHYGPMPSSRNAKPWRGEIPRRSSSGFLANTQGLGDDAGLRVLYPEEEVISYEMGNLMGAAAFERTYDS